MVRQRQANTIGTGSFGARGGCNTEFNQTRFCGVLSECVPAFVSVFSEEMTNSRVIIVLPQHRGDSVVRYVHRFVSLVVFPRRAAPRKSWGAYNKSRRESDRETENVAVWNKNADTRTRKNSKEV